MNIGDINHWERAEKIYVIIFRSDSEGIIVMYEDGKLSEYWDPRDIRPFRHDERLCRWERT